MTPSRAPSAALMLAVLVAATPAVAQKDTAAEGPLAAILSQCTTPAAPGLTARVAALTAQGWREAGAGDTESIATAEALWHAARLLPFDARSEPDRRIQALDRAADRARADFARTLRLRAEGGPHGRHYLLDADGAVAVLEQPRPDALACRLSTSASVARLSAILAVGHETRTLGLLSVTTFQTGASRFDSVERIALLPDAAPGRSVLPVVTTPPILIAD